MPAAFTSPGTIEVWRGRVRVYSGKPGAALLAELGKLIEAKADRAATFTVRLPAYPTAKYTKPEVGTISLAGDLPE